MEEKEKFENENEQAKMQGEGIKEDYIKAINDLRTNSVSKEDYEVLKEQNKELLKALVENKQIKEEESDARTSKDIWKDLVGSKTNLEFFQNVVALRNKTCTENYDPFLPQGKLEVKDPENDSIRTFYNKSESDVLKANAIQNAIEHCIQVADGDSDRFNYELNSILK